MASRCPCTSRLRQRYARICAKGVAMAIMVLGLRCSNSDYAYAILEGDAKRPRIIEDKLIAYPADYERTKLLRWFHQEMEGLLGKHPIRRLVIKGAEAMAKIGRAHV